MHGPQDDYGPKYQRTSLLTAHGMLTILGAVLLNLGGSGDILADKYNNMFDATKTFN